MTGRVDPTTAWWLLGLCYAVFAISFAVSVELNRRGVVRRPRRGLEHGTQPAEAFEFAAGMALFFACAGGVAVVLELPPSTPVTPIPFVVLIGAAALRGGLLIGQVRGPDGSVIAVFALVVDSLTVVVAALSAFGITGWGVLWTLAWANACAGIVAVSAFLVAVVVWTLSGA